MVRSRPFMSIPFVAIFLPVWVRSFGCRATCGYGAGSGFTHKDTGGELVFPVAAKISIRGAALHATAWVAGEDASVEEGCDGARARRASARRAVCASAR